MSLQNLAYDLKRIMLRRATLHVRIANTALPVEVPITSIVDNGAGLATVTTAAAHGYSTSNSITIYGAYQSRFNGTFTITVTSATTFTYAVSGSAAGTATGTIAAVKGTTLDAADVFYSLGLIRDAEVTWEPINTSASTSGKEHYIGAKFMIEAVIQQTGDEEFAAIEELCTNPLDVAVFSNCTIEQQTNTAAIVSALENGFLVYDVLATTMGNISLNGSENGITIRFPFLLARNVNSLVTGI